MYFSISVYILLKGLVNVKVLSESMFQKASFLATVHGAKIHSFSFLELDELKFRTKDVVLNI